MDYKLAFPGRFVEAIDLKGREVTVTIAALKLEEIDGKTKLIMRLEGAKKELLVNRTNAEAIRLMFGREMDAWLGKRITIYPITMKDPFSTDDTATIAAIRVRGSPDISATLTDSPKVGKKTIHVRVVPTGNAAARPAPQQPPPPKAPPVVDVLTGETEDDALERTSTRDPFAGNGLDHGHGLNGSGL